MQTVTCTEMPNGARYLSTEGKQMDIINVLTQKEFKEKFPEVSTYGIEMHMPVFLENGEILLGEVIECDLKEAIDLFVNQTKDRTQVQPKDTCAR